MLKALSGIIMRDLTLYMRRRGDCLMPVVYFVMVVSLFPMALDLEPVLLAQLIPGIIWVAVVLSLLMSLENLYRSDHQEGSFEQFMLSSYPLPVLLLGKSIAHWLAIGLPLLLLAPMIGFLLHLPLPVVWVLWLTLLIGIPTISLLATIGVALTIGLHRGGLLLAVLVLPLIMPVMIFGSLCVKQASQGMPFSAELFLLLALLVLTLGFVPVVIATAVRIGVE